MVEVHHNHLAVYSRKRSKDYIHLMLTGVKTVDIKLSYTKSAPYQHVQPQDWVYIKEASGPIVGRLQIPTVDYYEIPYPEKILEILLSIWQPLGLDNLEHAFRMYEKVLDKRYATVFTLSNPQKPLYPVEIWKRDRRIWVPNFQPPFQVMHVFGLDPIEERG